MSEDLAGLRAAVDAALAAGDANEARALLQELWSVAAGPAVAGFVLSRWAKLPADRVMATCRLYVLRSFTVEPLVPLVRAGAAVAGIDLQVTLGDYNAYAQELLDPGSALYQSAPDVVILAIQSRNLVPELWADFADLSSAAVESVVERTSAELRGWVEGFRARSSARLVIHTFELPAWPATGLLDAQGPAGQTAAFRRLNTALARLAGDVPGVTVLDYEALVARHGRAGWFDARKYQAVKLPVVAEHLQDLADAWLQVLHPVAGRVAKVLVCDLDHTLWGGVIGEDGPDGLQLGEGYPGVAYHEFQRAVLDLHRRGVILAINSKNNLADVLPILRDHPPMVLREEHFAALRINWQDKAQNLRELAAELNVGVDSLAMVDDNPVECARIRRALPTVAVLQLPAEPLAAADWLRGLPWFERLTLTAEDRERGRLYAEQRQRETLRSSADDLESFYASLQMTARIAPAKPSELARVAQMTQRTNQFNLTTRRRSDPEVQALAAEPHWLIQVTSVRDRFGDNGIVGLVIAERGAESWELDTFLMSCRVIGRTVETAMLAAIAEAAWAAGARELAGWFHPTAKNAPAADFYRTHGFREVGADGESRRWALDLRDSLPASPAWIELETMGS